MTRIIYLLLLIIPALAGAEEMNVEGRIFSDLGPFTGARIQVYKNFQDLQSRTPFYVSKPADTDGIYRAQLPAGEYYFTAQGERDGKEYFGYHGKNPIRLGKEKTWISLIANRQTSPPLYSEGASQITGVATYKGVPVTGAYVAVYDVASRPFRGLGLRTESVGADGRFKLGMPAGKYVVVVKKNDSIGKGNKPLKKGDLFCYYPQNPVEVKENKSVEIEVPCYPKDDRTAFVDTPALNPGEYATLTQIAAKSKAGISGRVTDAQGKPVPGLTVLACKTESPVFMMYHLSHGTEYTGETDKNGDYFIPIDKPGDYSLVARDILGDGPHQGETYGLYQDNHRHTVSYKGGEAVSGVNIVVGKVMTEPLRDLAAPPEFGAISPTGNETIKKQTMITDRVIDRNTVWEGEILIKGVVSVKRGVTLTLKPGTVVRFTRMDRDHNGVGDGEILVEGRLVARGTPEKRIVFTSAEASPQINDWSYVQFLAAETDNVLEYCKFEWAYAGVMVHYSNVKISDCLFTNNNRGLHFNTANLDVDHNTFVNNKIGIRFMRFEGDIAIRNNLVNKNEVGVLFVRQHVNAVDFRKSQQGKEAPRFRDNSICANTKYNVSLGEGQDLDITLSNNWWCETDPAKVAGTVFDANSDSELSRVTVTPIRTTAVPQPGIRE